LVRKTIYLNDILVKCPQLLFDFIIYKKKKKQFLSYVRILFVFVCNGFDYTFFVRRYSFFIAFIYTNYCKFNLYIHLFFM